jgi:hypothetical protein
VQFQAPFWKLWAFLPVWSQTHPLISVSPSGKVGEQFVTSWGAVKIISACGGFGEGR